jgi:hypothetical protein
MRWKYIFKHSILENGLFGLGRNLHRRRFKMRQNGLKIKYYNIITMNSKRSIMTCSVQKNLSFELKIKVCKADFYIRAVPAFLL